MVTIAEYLRQTTPKYYRQKKAIDNASDPTSLTTPQSRPQPTTAPGSAPKLNTTSLAATLPKSGVRGVGNMSSPMLSTALAPTTTPSATSPSATPPKPGYLDYLGRRVLLKGFEMAASRATSPPPPSPAKLSTMTRIPSPPPSLKERTNAVVKSIFYPPTLQRFIKDTAEGTKLMAGAAADYVKDNPDAQQTVMDGLSLIPGATNLAVNRGLASGAVFGNLYEGNIPENQGRYNYLIQNMLGGDDKSNPYTNYFNDKTTGSATDNYSDIRYVYELMHIMKHNPEASKMFMHRIMSGENTTFLPMIKNLSQHFKAHGDNDKAAKLLKMHNYLLSQQGQLGNTMMGPEIQGALLNKALPTVMGMMEEEMSGKEPLVQGGFKALKEMANQAHFRSYNGDYSPLYWKTMGNDFYKNNFYGMLNSPEAQGALQYAAPWAAYGVPLASAGSLLGFNGLWLPILAGGAASGTYGSLINQGYLSDTAHSNVGQAFDRITRQVNGPLNSIMQLIPGFERIGGTLVTQRNLPAGRPIEDMFNDYMKPEKPTQ